MTPSQLRASLILQVRTGQITAQEAARQLGISRQAFYKWEKRALQALLDALQDQPPGRPKGTTDPEKDQLKSRVEQLEQQVRLYEQRDNLRTLLKQMESRSERDSTKKNSK
ncbi:MAG TPA: helix-turn-helix domain-containing protein [Candidatus Methylomirabilis sp.]|nr:helix-turn-helix domain-containing protein [Candidatus Methylomirabilis sp.]